MSRTVSTRVRATAGVAALLAVTATGSAAATAAGSTGATGFAGFAGFAGTTSGDASAAAVSGTSREAAALTGSAKLSRSEGDDITFTFDAHLAAEDNDNPLQATGTFSFSHYLDGEGNAAEGNIDCLVTGGKVAVVTGVITETDIPGGEGLRVGVTVHDNGRHDRLGYSWASTGNPMEMPDLPRCVSSAPFEKVLKGTGDFHVLPWQPDF